MDWLPWNMVCSISYSSSTKIIHLMTLGWRWPFLWQGQIWDNANTLDFIESFECFGQNKNGNKSCLNEYTKIYE